jgi:peroxiredoxin
MNMKIAIIVLLTLLFSCEIRTGKKSLSEAENPEPKVDLKEIESDFTTWWTYHSYNISLSSNFNGLNEQSDTIVKGQFLKILSTAGYIPLKMKSGNKDNTYKLFKLGSDADKSIGITIKNESLTVLKHFNMEGLPLPAFKFTDLNGIIYTNENTKGKILILKTWFINCKACVAEFPELNDLVEKYRQRNDMIFVSLALDSEADLKIFLQQKGFDYKVVSNQKEFIMTKLNLQLFPTHLVADKDGNILKVVNKASEMIAFLENEKPLNEKLPPPPPPPPM